MHTARELASDAFGVFLDGRPSSLEAVLPGFGEPDRLGVVVREPCGATGASALVLAAITAFYDVQRGRGEDFFIYPDYFLLHVGGPLGDHGMLDVWPAHKEVVVDDDAEAILRAVNDRAVTRLLVPDGRPGAPAFSRESLASARSRLRTALAYDAGGRVRDADVRIAGTAVTEGYVEAVLERSTGVAPAARARIADRRRVLVEHGVPVESYRRLQLDEALALLAPAG